MPGASTQDNRLGVGATNLRVLVPQEGLQWPYTSSLHLEGPQHYETSFRRRSQRLETR
jgi:hypothetical protein